ncbi:MAG: OprO/OprP family phosphate-selective porin [Phycisphaerales bacterium]|nr:OprO/OprP family phosphate-selective porin [Phycisphaerales bacterium]
MNISMWTTKAAITAAAILFVNAGSPAHANEDLATELKALKARITELEEKQNNNWLSEERTIQIRGIVEGVLADAQKQKSSSSSPDFGYNNGFFIQSPDKKNKLQITGNLQFRYVYAHSEVRNREAFAAEPAHGDASAFGFRRARLYFSGNVLDPNLIFMVSGDFGAAAGSNFEMLDTFIGYNFTPALKVKAGSMTIPFTYAELNSSGIIAPEAASTHAPFNAGRTLGISLYGDLIKDELAYEVQISNGSRSHTAGRPPYNSDNRPAFYGRLEWAGNGNMRELKTESDNKGSKDFIWLLGVAAGYEEQAPNDPFTLARRTTLALNGLSTDRSPGFRNISPVQGALYRGTADFHAKYQGLAVAATVYAQHLNSDVPLFNNSSTITQIGYTLQAGYMIVPEKLELIARFGQVLTPGLPNRMEEYTVGANYYLYGQNAKFQLAATFVPNEAIGDQNGANTIQNTQDVILQAQLSLRF